MKYRTFIKLITLSIAAQTIVFYCNSQIIPSYRIDPEAIMIPHATLVSNSCAFHFDQGFCNSLPWSCDELLSIVDQSNTHNNYMYIGHNILFHGNKHRVDYNLIRFKKSDFLVGYEVKRLVLHLKEVSYGSYPNPTEKTEIVLLNDNEHDFAVQKNFIASQFHKIKQIPVQNPAMELIDITELYNHYSSHNVNDFVLLVRLEPSALPAPTGTNFGSVPRRHFYGHSSNISTSDKVYLKVEYFPPSYSKLHPRLDGELHYTFNDELLFEWEGEYNLGGLDFDVIDETGASVKSSVSMTNSSKEYGYNKYHMGVDQLVNLKIYTLKITNEKNETYYLRFQKRA